VADKRSPDCGKGQALLAVVVAARTLPVRRGLGAVGHILRGMRQGVHIRTVLCVQHEYGEKYCNEALTGRTHWNLLQDCSSHGWLEQDGILVT
jgi:hypothetical protein